MRLLLALLPVLSLGSVQSFAQNPIVTTPVDGADTVKVATSVPAGSTATLVLYRPTAGICTVVATSLIPLNPAGDFIVKSASSDLKLAGSLAQGDQLCAAEVDTPAGGAAAAPKLSKVVTVTAVPAPGAPAIGSATTGSKTIGITSQAFPAGTTSATYALYTVDTGSSCAADASKQLASAAGTSSTATASASTTLTLTQALAENTRICAVETFKDAAGNVVSTSQSAVTTVTSPDINWGRVNAYFVGGVLITNDSSAFSSAHQFYDLTVEKSWGLPGCYLRVVSSGKTTERCAARGATTTEAVDLSGGKITAQGNIKVRGSIAPGSITDAVGQSDKDENVTFTTSTGQVTTITIPAKQDFRIAEAKRTSGTAIATEGGIRISASSTIEIVSGAVESENPTTLVTGFRGWWLRHYPGNSSYFETRLTAIPVVSNGTNTNTNTTTGTTGGTASLRPARAAHAATGTQSSTPACDSSASADPSTSSNSSCSFITSPQTAHLGVGIYLPFLLTRWDFNNTPNALFLAPIGKIGFNTITGSTSQSVTLPGGGTGTQNLEQIYNYYDYGVRIGQMGLTRSTNVAPVTYNYLDISLGRFSNLESLICHFSGTPAQITPHGSGCKGYTDANYLYDSRKRLYRLDLEGLLKIPTTIFYIGFNANIGQKEFQAARLDPAFKAPDDLRFLFGTKFDIASVFQKLGVK